jgi:hypothetical protein
VKTMMPTTGKGKELQDLLRRELNIPPTCKWFEVRFAIGETVGVTVAYHAVEPEPLPGDQKQ